MKLVLLHELADVTGLGEADVAAVLVGRHVLEDDQFLNPVNKN